MFNPEWIEAAADAAAVVEKGVAMRNKKQVEAAAAGPTAPTVVVNGISGQDFLMGVLILAGTMLVIAAAVLVGAAIIHHGLTA
jgi:hypothetical protein